MTALPDYIVTTGDFISEWMEDNDVHAAELARRLSVTRKHVSELLSGKAALSHAVALNLERVTGVPARIWNAYETGYREDLARLTEQTSLEGQYQKAKAFPLAYLRKWNFITARADDHANTVSELLTLLGIADFDAFDATWAHSKVAYRKTPLKTDKTPTLAAWLAIGEQQFADLGEISPYDAPQLEQLLPELKKLSANKQPLEALEEVQQRLLEVGVAVCYTPPIDGLGIYGATRWIHQRPLIQLSFLRKTDDQLWFTLFHELGHVLLHNHGQVFLAGKTIENRVEQEANQFASNELVPKHYQKRLPIQRDISAIVALAEELEIAPSIVLGQAQRRTNDYAWGHRLKVKFDWQPPTASL